MKKKNWIEIWSNENPESLEGTRKFSPNFKLDEKITTSLIRIDISLKREISYYQIAGICLLTGDSTTKHQLSISPILNTLFHDFKIIINDSGNIKEYPTSKLLLSTLSAYFFDLLQKNQQLNEIEYEFNLELFDLIYLYLNSMKISYFEIDIVKMFSIADQLSLDNFKNQILNNFQKCINLDDYHHYFNDIIESKSPNIQQLQLVLDNFVCDEFSTIISQENFKEISVEFIRYYCMKSEIRVREYDLCLSIYNRDNKMKMNDLIRFGNIKGTEWESIKSILKLNEKPNNNKLPRRLVKE